jgi:serine/threonine-protein kinase
VSASKVCPRCGDEYDSAVQFCAKDGTRLVAIGRAGVDLVGAVIADRYRITSKLGEGGMGQVYLGEHVRMKRKSAIKIMRPSLVGDVEALQRFTREAENASQISHPNVAAIYDFGETDDNIVYLAMEYIDGEPLANKLKRELALHPDVASDILGQSADALQAAHDMGILHRDLKPDNIMLGRRADGTYMVKLVDFGIARTMDRGEQKLTRTGFAVGTPEYMSPEQLSGDSLDARSDQYSLALVAFVALTGKDAFPSESSKESLIARLTSRPRTLQEAKQDVNWPEALQVIFDKALSPEPADRYESVREFADVLATSISLMTPSQTATIYRRALEQRLASVAMRTPHSDMNAIRTPITAQPALAKVTDSSVPVASGEPVTGVSAPASASLANVPVAAASTVETPAPRVRRGMSSALKAVMLVSAAFLIGILGWALYPGQSASAPVASADSLAAPAIADTSPTVAVGMPQETVPSDTVYKLRTLTPAEVADSLKRLQRDSVRKDSVAKFEKARRDSIRRRAAAVETFPAAAITAGRAIAPNWRERSTRGSDVRVVLMTPQVSAWRADEARRWKETHVRSDGGPPYTVVDPIETWSPWKTVISARRPVVVIEVKSERAPFETIEPEKLVEFRRGDVQSVQLLRDGAAMALLNGERFPGVVNDARHRELKKAVAFSYAAISPPDAFAPRPDGSWPKMELLVVDAMNRGKEARIQLSESLIRRVHEDFAPYRDALK